MGSRPSTLQVGWLSSRTSRTRVSTLGPPQQQPKRAKMFVEAPTPTPLLQQPPAHHPPRVSIHARTAAGQEATVAFELHYAWKWVIMVTERHAFTFTGGTWHTCSLPSSAGLTVTRWWSACRQMRTAHAHHIHLQPVAQASDYDDLPNAAPPLLVGAHGCGCGSNFRARPSAAATGRGRAQQRTVVVAWPTLLRYYRTCTTPCLPWGAPPPVRSSTRPEPRGRG